MLASRHVLLVVCILGGAGALPAQDPDSANKVRRAIDWTFEPSHTVLNERDGYFYVRIRATAVAAESPRRPLNLALVFDRSGSMQDESKIGFVRQAGHLVTDNLTPQDHVALVAYSDRVQTLAPLHQVVNREYLHHRIDELYAAGQTNLSGGLLEGCAQLDKRLDQPGLHHVILLTDGLANRGVTDPKELVRVAKRCAARGITISTIGVGKDYNETLLSEIATAAGGRYVYASKPDEIPAALEKELGTLLAVVAQNVKLEMDLPAGVTLEKVFGREDAAAADRLDLPLGDFASGEDRVLLVKFRVAGGDAASGPISIPVTMTYDEVAEADRVKGTQKIAIERAGEGATVATKPGPVLAYARLVEAVDKIALAVVGMDLRLASEVQQIRQQEFPALKQIAVNSRDQDFVNKAFMFEHYARDLQDLIDRGALHEHSQQRADFQKEFHYRRYLLEHHGGHPH